MNFSEWFPYLKEESLFFYPPLVNHKFNNYLEHAQHDIKEVIESEQVRIF